jgi:hypothetical protein
LSCISLQRKISRVRRITQVINVKDTAEMCLTWHGCCGAMLQ